MNWVFKYDFLLVSILFLVVELIVNPFGEFPLNDDWAYSKLINNCLIKGEFKYSNWQAIPGLPQFAVGLAIAKVFGFSFTVLRLTTILITLLMIFIFNTCLNENKIKPILKVFILLTFVFNPLIINLSNTFLPDIIQLFFCLLAFKALIRFTKKENAFNFILFIFFTLLGTLNRQSALALPLIFALIYIYKSPKTAIKFLVALLPLIVNVLALIITESLLKSYHTLPANYNLQLQNILNSVSHPTFNIIKSTAYYFICSTMCLGLFILPLVILNFKKHFKMMRNSIVSKSIFLIYIALIVLKIILSENVFPFTGNMFYHLGLGPIILTGFNTDQPSEISFIAKTLWVILNFVGGIGFYFSINSIVKQIRSSCNLDIRTPGLFFIFLLVFYLLPVCMNYANDRYLIFVLPFYILSYVLSIDNNGSNLFFVALFSPMLYFSVASTHDYLEVNRMRWNASNYLIKKLRISPEKIDGGFEFNAWYFSETGNYIPSHKGRWWWVGQPKYIISLKVIKGAVVESEFKFNSLLFSENNKIYVLRYSKPD